MIAIRLRSDGTVHWDSWGGGGVIGKIGSYW